MLEINKVYCGDCLPMMRGFPDKYFDLVLTDPPYGVGEAAGKNKHRSNAAPATDFGNLDWDNKPPSKEYFTEMIRISKNQIIFGGNFFELPPSPCWIVWDKDNTGDFADCELAWTSFKSTLRKFKWRWNGMLQEDMKHKEKHIHPTQKPLPLIKWLLEKYSKPYDLILDPFLGSGTTAVAAIETNRRFIGIDKESTYIEIANKRISGAKIFSPVATNLFGEF